MRIALEDICTFSFCPRYYKYSKQSIRLKSKKLSIIDKAVKRAYSRQTEYERHSEWRSILGWIDKEVFKDVDIDDRESFISARKLSEDILLFIQKWYRFIYIRNDNPSYINIPVSYDFSSDVVFGEIPIVQINQDVPLIIYIDEVEHDNVETYNNIKVMGWAHMLFEELDIEEIHIKHLCINTKSGISSNPKIIRKHSCSRVKEIIRQIAISIRTDISYPSYTKVCRDCQFRRQCKI